MTFYDWVRQYPDVERTALARRALAECDDEMLISVLAREIDHVRRVEAREREAAELGRFLRAHAPDVTPDRWGHVGETRRVGPTDDPLTDFYQALGRSFLDREFALGDGTRVTWGEATAEQHRIRAAFLRGQARGLVDTAERHETAATVLEQTGAPCLRALALKEAV